MFVCTHALKFRRAQLLLGQTNLKKGIKTGTIEDMYRIYAKFVAMKRRWMGYAPIIDTEQANDDSFKYSHERSYHSSKMWNDGPKVHKEESNAQRERDFARNMR